MLTLSDVATTIGAYNYRKAYRSQLLVPNNCCIHALQSDTNKPTLYYAKPLLMQPGGRTSVLHITGGLPRALDQHLSSDTKRLCAQRLDHLVNDAIFQSLLGVKVLVAVEIKLDLHAQHKHVRCQLSHLAAAKVHLRAATAGMRQGT